MAKLLILLLVACLPSSHGGLLGAGEGLGSCAAYPFRAYSVHWVGGCPPHAPCCSEFGFCRPRAEWDYGHFRDCNGVSNSSPLPKEVLHAEAAAGPHHGKPAGAIGPSPYHHPVEPAHHHPVEPAHHHPVQDAYHEPAPHPHNGPIHNEYVTPTHGHPTAHGQHKPKAHHPTSCPYVPSKPPHACPSHPKGIHCWSEGVPDLDCPHSALCCFDGCSNTCIGPHHVVEVHAPLPKQPYAHKDKYQTSYVSPGPIDPHHHSTANPLRIHHSTTIAPPQEHHFGGHHSTTMIPPTKLYQPPPQQTVYQQPRAMQPPTKLYQAPPTPHHHHQTSYKPSPTPITTMKPPVKQYEAPAHQVPYQPPIKQPYQSDFKTFEQRQTTVKPLHTTMHPPAKLYAPPQQHLASNHLGGLTPKSTMAPPIKLYQPPKAEAIFTGYQSTLKPLHSTPTHPQPVVRLYEPPIASYQSTIRPHVSAKPTFSTKIITSSLPSLRPGPFVTPLPAMLSLDPGIIQPHLPSHGFAQAPLLWSGPKPRLLPNGMDHQPNIPLDHQTFMMGPHPKPPPAALPNFVTPLPASKSSPSLSQNHPHPVVSHSSESGIHHPGSLASMPAIPPPPPSIRPALGEPQKFLPPMLHMPVSPRTLEQGPPAVTESPNHPVELTTMIAFVRAMQEHKLPPGFNAIPAVPVEEKGSRGGMPRPPPLPSPPLLAMIEDGAMQCQPSGPNRQFTCFPIDQPPQPGQQQFMPGSQPSLQMAPQNFQGQFEPQRPSQFPGAPVQQPQQIFGPSGSRLTVRQAAPQGRSQHPSSLARSTTTLPPFIGPQMPSVVRHKRKDAFEARSDESGNIDYIQEEEEVSEPEGVVKKKSKINLEYELEMKTRILEMKKRDLEMKKRNLEMKKRKADVEERLIAVVEGKSIAGPGSEDGQKSTPLHLVLSRNSTQMLKQKAATEIKISTPDILQNIGRTIQTPFPTASTHERIKKADINVKRTSMSPPFKNDIIESNSTPPPPPVTTNIPTADLLAAIWAAATSTTTTTTKTTTTTQVTTTTTSRTTTTTIRPSMTPTSAPSLVNHFLALKSVSPSPVSLVVSHDQSTSAKLSPSPVSSMDVYKSALRPVMETNLADLGNLNLATAARQESESGKSEKVLTRGRLSPAAKVPEMSKKLTPVSDLGQIPPDASQSRVPVESKLEVATSTWQTNNPSRQNPAMGAFHPGQNPIAGSVYERGNTQIPSSRFYKGDLEQVPSSHHQVILLGPHSLPETLDSLEKVLSNGPNSIKGREVGLDKVGAIAKPSQSISSAIPSKEEILSIIGISKQPTSIKKTLSSLDKVSSKKEEKKKMLAALKERAKQSNINYNKPQQVKSPKVGNGDGATAFQTIYNPVTGRPLGLVSSGDGSFFPVSLPGSVGVSPRPFHPREHNLLAATTDEFHMLKQVQAIKTVQNI